MIRAADRNHTHSLKTSSHAFNVPLGKPMKKFAVFFAKRSNPGIIGIK